MKKITAVVLAFIILFSVVTPAHADIMRFSDSDRQYFDVDGYYEMVWDRFNFLFEEHRFWWFITQGGDTFLYQRSVENFDNLNWFQEILISFAKQFTNETPTVERYIEILVNFMMLMRHDLDEVHNHMSEADALKTFWDYTQDVAAVGMSLLKLERTVNKNVMRFGGLAYSTINLVKDCYYSYRLLSKMLLDFENQFYFLTAIIEYADNDNLVQASRILRNNVERAMEYRLNFFVENTYRIAEYIGRDILIDVIVMEMITNPEHLGQLGLSAVEAFGLVTLAKGYVALGKVMAAYNVIRGFGVFSADMIVGLSNVLNRVVEMRVMYDINQALIKSTENLRRNVQSIDDKVTIERIVDNMRSILYVNARGDYLLYQLAMRDGQFLSLFFTDRQAVSTWYGYAQRNFNSLSFWIERFYPDLELSRWDYVDEYAIDFIPEYLHHQVMEAYMEFIRRGEFEAYINPNSWAGSFDRYAIVNISGDGIPVLLVNSHDGFGWHTDLIFMYDFTKRNIIYVSVLNNWLGTGYSQQHGAFVYIPVRTHVGAGIFSFRTLNDLLNKSISFTLSFDDGLTSGEVHNVLIYGDWWEFSEPNVLIKDISEIELRQYFEGVIWIEYSNIP